MSPNTIASLIPRMAKKVKVDRGTTYRIVAMAFTKRNNYLGMSMNGFRDHLSNRRGAGAHAEMKLIQKYGRQIDTIYLLRVGNALDPLPIHPCENCSKVIQKMGIKVILLHEEFLNLDEYIKK